MQSTFHKDDLLSQVGRLSQLGGVSSFICNDGRSKGTSAVRVKTAAGLEFWVIPDRGMDIYEASYRGQSLSWLSPQGIVHPAYFSNYGIEWLKTFSGGLLTTCGLSTAGVPGEDTGEQLGLHGPIAATPAEHVNWIENWDGDDCRFTVKGAMRESSVHGWNLLMERTITTSLHSTALEITDTVTNEGFRETPLMLLYHINLGYPLLTPKSKIYAPSTHADPATDFARESADTWSNFEAPVRHQQERVYFHTMQPNAQNEVTVVLVQDDSKKDFGLALTYNTENLPEFVQWKMTGENHFVLGLEPSNCRTMGRAWHRQHGRLQSLKPGEQKTFRMRLQVLDGADALSTAIQS